ncbi:MAG: LysR family transcriptional regulator [Raoultibacter sp.]|jgi:LysR family hydrogen peroxide-inducible transcriptional activator
MELHQLKYVSHVARYGSVAQASNELYVSRQAISKAIRSLEQEFGFEIFDRDNKMRPTDAGKEVIKHAEAVLQELNKIDMLVDAENDKTQVNSCLSIALSAFPLDFLYFNSEHEVMKLLEEFKRRTSGLTLSFYHQSDSVILNALQRGSIDVGFVHGRYTRDGIKVIPVSKVEMRVITYHDHPFASQSSVKVSELEGVPIRSPLDFDLFTNGFIARCEEHGFTPQYHVVPLNDESIHNFCNAGGIHLQPYNPSMEKKYPESVFTPFHPNDRKDLPLCLAYKNPSENPQVTKLVNFFNTNTRR